MLTTNNELIDSILQSHKSDLGNDLVKYRNHVYRVFNLALMLSEPLEDDYKALEVAAVFHDLGIWTAKTFDYLEPSVRLASQYLSQNGLTYLYDRVAEVINNHHKLGTYKLNPLAEAFRKADLIDLSFGFFSFGIKREQMKELNNRFPSLGFHRFIIGQSIKNTFKHPLNPLPMMRM
jgi:hypothetical protein